jgi:hypothetical protein
MKIHCPSGWTKAPHASVMAQQRKALWEADIDEDFHDVDLNLAIGSYGQNGLYDDCNSSLQQYDLGRGSLRILFFLQQPSHG